MKILFLICLIILPGVCFSQLSDSIYLLSNGYNDRNPSSPKFHSSEFSYMMLEEGYFVFERALGDTTSNIMLQKITFEGASGVPVAITSGNSLNINPSISYLSGTNFFHTSPQHIFIVWQKFESDRWNIKGKYFDHVSGWSQELDVSSDTANEVVPRVINKDTTTFILTFERDGNIIYKKFDLLTATFSNEFNLTEDREFPSENAFAFHQNGVTTVSFEGHFYDSLFFHYTWVIVYRESHTPNQWDSTKMLSYDPFAINEGFLQNRKFVYGKKIFGVYWVYYRTVPGGETIIEFPPVFVHGDAFSYAQADVIVTDAFPFVCHGIAFSMLELPNYFVTVAYGNQYVQRQMINTTGGYKPKLTVTEKLISPSASHCYRNWFIFNDQKLSGQDQYQSRITGIIFNNCLAGLSQSNGNIPEDFILHQNYPNPFNPVTTLKFSLPISGHTKLTVFDALGREIQTLVNETLQPGNYEYDFDALGLSSGIYFYRLEASEFTDVKKLTFLK